MDPTANLEEQRTLVKRLSRTELGPNQIQRYMEDAHRLAELVEALDAWISNEGFLPTQWRIRFVRNYQTGYRLEGTPSPELIAESAKGNGTGAVSAYCDSEGVWQYVPESDTTFFRAHRKETVITVWVE